MDTFSYRIPDIGYLLRSTSSSSPCPWSRWRRKFAQRNPNTVDVCRTFPRSPCRRRDLGFRICGCLRQTMIRNCWQNPWRILGHRTAFTNQYSTISKFYLFRFCLFVFCRVFYISFVCLFVFFLLSIYSFIHARVSSRGRHLTSLYHEADVVCHSSLAICILRQRFLFRANRLPFVPSTIQYFTWFL